MKNNKNNQLFFSMTLQYLGDLSSQVAWQEPGDNMLLHGFPLTVPEIPL